jgi:cell division protein FtsI/penicillin-binding protein 2
MIAEDNNDDISVPSAPISPWRMYVIITLFSVGIIYILLGLFYRQLIQSKDLISKSNSQSETVVWLPPARGKIYDRNKVVLVENRVRWSVKADMMLLEGEIDREYKSLVKSERENLIVLK